MTQSPSISIDPSTRDKQKKKFWNRIAKRYARSPVSDEASYQKKLVETQKRFTADSTVLEFGCGTGTTALIHAEYIKHIDAVDISENMLAIAEKKREEKQISNIRFHTASIESFQCEKDSHDVVMAHSLLHLLDNKEAAIEKIHQLIKPGGYFVSSTICMTDGFSFMRFVLPFLRVIGLVPNVEFFSASGLETTVKNAGFEIEYRWHPQKNKALFLIARKTQ